MMTITLQNIIGNFVILSTDLLGVSQLSKQLYNQFQQVMLQILILIESLGWKYCCLQNIYSIDIGIYYKFVLVYICYIDTSVIIYHRTSQLQIAPGKQKVYTTNMKKEEENTIFFMPFSFKINFPVYFLKYCLALPLQISNLQLGFACMKHRK